MVEQVREFRVNIEVYRDTNKQTYREEESFESFEDALTWLKGQDGVEDDSDAPVFELASGTGGLRISAPDEDGDYHFEARDGFQPQTSGVYLGYGDLVRLRDALNRELARQEGTR